ncbi:hypothetical protein VNO77_22753 [Canavalia gladiata]|uniref:Uncharacterized protein n=1 Tax=Canavalia gladiata TaxID=3824 RepID=A0AAN9QB98_CANGL
MQGLKGKDLGQGSNTKPEVACTVAHPLIHIPHWEQIVLCKRGFCSLYLSNGGDRHKKNLRRSSEAFRWQLIDPVLPSIARHLPLGLLHLCSAKAVVHGKTSMLFCVSALAWNLSLAVNKVLGLTLSELFIVENFSCIKLNFLGTIANSVLGSACLLRLLGHLAWIRRASRNSDENLIIIARHLQFLDTSACSTIELPGLRRPNRKTCTSNYQANTIVLMPRFPACGCSFSSSLKQGEVSKISLSYHELSIPPTLIGPCHTS